MDHWPAEPTHRFPSSQIWDSKGIETSAHITYPLITLISDDGTT
jgi:hypothetical protein